MAFKREFALPWGVCDLVACLLHKTKAKKRLSLGQKQPIRTHARASVLSAIPDADESPGVSLDALAREMRRFYDLPAVEAEVEALIGGGYVTRTPRGALQKLNGWMPLSRKIIAIELKLARVQDALAQARAHLEFADESYVALPMARAARLGRGQARGEFDAEGVGILGVTRRHCSVLRRSRRSETPVCDVMQMLYVDRFWRDYVRGTGA